MSGDPFLDVLNKQAGGTGVAPVHPLLPSMTGITVQAESGGDPLAVSPKGAMGTMQVMPGTAADPGYGIRPAANNSPTELERVGREKLNVLLNRYNDPAKAWAAYNWGEGNVDKALKAHGDNWLASAPKETRDYVVKNTAQLQQGQIPPDPTQASDPNDPFLSALDHATQGNADPVPTQTVAGPSVPGSQGGDPVLRGAGSADLPPGLQGPAQEVGLFDNVAGGVHDLAQGIPEGWNAFQNDITRWGLKGTDALGLTDGAVSKFDRIQREVSAPYQNSLYVTPDGYMRSAGNLVGEGVAGAPLTEIRPLQALGMGGKLGGALARYGDMSIQGGLFGGVASGGENVGQNVAMGAALAPAFGAAADRVLPPAIKLAGALKTKAGEVLQPAWQKAVDEVAARKAAPIDTALPDAPLPRGAAVDAQGNALTPEQVAVQDAQAQSQGLTGEVTDTTNLHADPADLKAAGARSGIEATTRLPQPVAEDVARLKAQGVQGDHALNEASIRYVGGEPTVATSTRDRAAMQAEKEGAKLNTPEGQALAARAANNNAALHQTVQQTVADYGGVPADGSAAQTAAESLAKASDAAKAKVSAAYENARALDGDQRVSIDGVRELLDRPDYKAPTTAAGKELVKGLRAQIAAMSKANGGRFSPEEIDTLTKAVNAAYDPMGGGVNHMVGDLKGALSESLDQFDKAGPAYRQARAAHRQWAEAYDDPAGVANLIKRDANGNFLNADNWRAVEQRLVNGMSDKAFSQVVAQLKASGGEQALGRLKASIVQDAYENATRTAADETGHPVMSAKAWEAMLNKIGLPKLQALFSPDEIAHLSTIGRAARALNEGVPGTVNGSGTSSALINALGAQGKGASPVAKTLGRVLGHGVAAVTHPVVGNVAVEGVVHGADAAANRAAGSKLAKAINDSLDPEAARATANDNAISAAEAARRAALAKKLSDRLAPASASSNRQGGN